MNLSPLYYPGFATVCILELILDVSCDINVDKLSVSGISVGPSQMGKNLLFM